MADWVHSLRKISTWLCGTNFCINCSSSSRYAPSFMQLRNDHKCTIPNAPKHYETHQNMSLGSNGVDQVCSLRKIQCDFVARTFVLIEIVQYVLKQVSCSYGTILNAPKYYETHRNISLGSNGVDWMHSLRKIPTWLRGTNFCINCSSSPYFAPSFMQLRNDRKCIQHYETHQNMSLGSNGVDRVRSLRKITTCLRGTNFCINCTSSPRFAPSFM